ncbi:MAG: hypothetical protein HY096_12145 [Nitrospinae bacterium]|nr:hypothetical protein [Nitrospinota bacterium]
MKILIHKNRLLLVFSTIAYVAIFQWTYERLVAPRYDYWGLSYDPIPFPYLQISWVLAIFPATWMPIKLRRPSQLLFFIQYFVIFIPSCFILYYSSKPEIPAEEALYLILIMFCGLSIIQSFYSFPLLRLNYPRMKSVPFWFLFFCAITVLIGYILFTLGRNFNIANFEDIYDVRSIASDIVEGTGSRFGFYAQMWLAGFFFPVCFAVGLFGKRIWLIVLSGVGYLILFGIFGDKTSILSFILFPLVYFWVSFSRKEALSVFILGLSLLLVLGIVFEKSGFSLLSLWYIAVVHFRTFSIPALTIVQYYDFFIHNPVTMMSHVNGINMLVHFPYDMNVPYTIGNYYYGSLLDANAGMWAGDGLAGFGPFGIIIMSIACGILFWVLDCISKPLDTRFVVVAITFIAMSFGNASLSTVIVSGGIGFLLVALFVLPKGGVLRGAYFKKRIEIK